MKLKDKLVTTAVNFLMHKVASKDYSLKYTYALRIGTDALEQLIKERESGNTGGFTLTIDFPPTVFKIPKEEKTTK